MLVLQAHSLHGSVSIARRVTDGGHSADSRCQALHDLMLALVIRTQETHCLLSLTHQPRKVATGVRGTPPRSEMMVLKTVSSSVLAAVTAAAGLVDSLPYAVIQSFRNSVLLRLENARPMGSTDKLECSCPSSRVRTSWDGNRILTLARQRRGRSARNTVRRAEAGRPTQRTAPVWSVSPHNVPGAAREANIRRSSLLSALRRSRRGCPRTRQRLVGGRVA
jgi:hypothetical protein